MYSIVLLPGRSRLELSAQPITFSRMMRLSPGRPYAGMDTVYFVTLPLTILCAISLIASKKSAISAMPFRTSSRSIAVFDELLRLTFL